MDPAALLSYSCSGQHRRPVDLRSVRLSAASCLEQLQADNGGPGAIPSCDLGSFAAPNPIQERNELGAVTFFRKPGRSMPGPVRLNGQPFEILHEDAHSWRVRLDQFMSSE